jgi:AhpD family alkylhydroperoxidase
MQARLDAYKTSPGAYKAMRGLQAYVDKCGLEPTLLELVKIRASQINGCAFCLAMHTRGAARRARARSEFISSRPGARRRCTQSENARRSAGPTR